MQVDKERLVSDVESILGEHGILEQNIEGFRTRGPQVEMAQMVADSIADEVPLVLEGGTGIGKTLAYLVPAILSGLKVVVSTGTKTLQEQIFFKDLPNLLDMVDLPIKATYMKGRANYLCKLRYYQFSAQRLFRFAADGPLFDEIERWAEHTETGDRAELENLPDDYSTWPELSSNSDNCLGSNCRYFKSCFVTKMRKRAQDADLIIVNHHLYLADLAVKERAFGEVIPRHDLVIFDEAHLLESVATSYFGISASNYRVYSLLDDVVRWLKFRKTDVRGIRKTVEQVKTSAVRLFELFTFQKGRFKLTEQILDDVVQDAYLELDSHLNHLKTLLKEKAVEYDEAEGLVFRIEQLANDFFSLIQSQTENYVYWGEIRKRGVFLNASPLDVSPLMRQHLFSKPVNSIFTSATLSTGENFNFFRSRIGVPEEAREHVFLSPFDYRYQSLIFLPKVMPEPSNHQFTQRAAEVIGQLIRISKGAALILFTSYQNMNDVYDRLENKIDYPLFKQGDAPRSQLLEQFRQNVDSVLFATGTFWQGVDVLGSSLRLVVIDKLPFESPGDPIIEGRIEYMKSKGENPFATFQVPSAIIQLKQGVGRLIRDKNDWGVIGLLDRRIATKGYGKRFQKALPPSIRTEKLDNVATWWRRKESMEN